LVKKVLVLPLIVLLLPVSIIEKRTSYVSVVPIADEPEATVSQSLTEFKSAIETRGQSLADQGVLIETLDNPHSVAEHNADVTFNPASVMKLATSFVALAKLGPDYRYRTNFRAGGSIDWNTHTLEGDLIVQGGSNPIFSSYDAQEVALQLSKLGITHVTGGLRIAGPFYYFATGYHSNLSAETSAGKLRMALQRSGTKIDGATVFGASEGPLLLSHYSDPLESILLFQNAHSSNAIAEVVGASIGGPRAIQDYLVEKVGLGETDLFVGRASGLDFNRITPRATLKVLRALIQLLADHSLRPEDVMAVAGIDSGTLHGRLAREDVRGGVVAKTGTLVSLDNGVSTLVGIAYTKAKGPLLFAVFDSGGNVNAYRHLQDQFIEQMIAESGGAVAVSRSEDALAEVIRHSIVQVLWKPGDQSADTATE